MNYEDPFLILVYWYGIAIFLIALWSCCIVILKINDHYVRIRDKVS